MREIYASENGDAWYLLRDFGTGHTFVRHTANQPSGGNIADISLPEFLSLGHDGPEQQAVWALIGSLVEGGTLTDGLLQSAPEIGAAAAEPLPGEEAR